MYNEPAGIQSRIIKLYQLYRFRQAGSKPLKKFCALYEYPNFAAGKGTTEGNDSFPSLFIRL